MKSALSLLKRHKYLFAIIILLLALGYRFSRNTPVSPFETTQVARGEVLQEVSVTGRVNADSEVVLSFERSGRVSSIPRAVGARVRKGDAVVRLDTSELNALRAQASANLEAEQAKLAEIKKGTREEDIAVSQAQLGSAQSALDQARLGVLDRISTAWNASDDAIRNVSDQFFRNPRTRNPEINFPLTDSRLASDLPSDRVVLETVLDDWQRDLATWSSSDDLETPITTTKNRIEEIRAFLDVLALAINSLTPSSSLSQVTIDGWKLDVSSARTSISTAQSGLLSAVEKYHSANEGVKIAENQLALKVAGPTSESIQSQEARVSAARAAVSNYDAQIAKAVLVAPLSGVITIQNAKQGETVNAGTPVVTLMSDTSWKIEANVPEVDVAKVHVEDHARVTFDAYGPDVPFDATVVAIDPAETVISGVSTYKVTLRLDREDDRIRSGMTADINIKTDRREDVLYVPTRAVVTKNEAKFVRIPDPDGLTARDVSVEVGLRGSDGHIEIVKGVAEGDTVVIFEKK